MAARRRISRLRVSPLRLIRNGISDDRRSHGRCWREGDQLAKIRGTAAMLCISLQIHRGGEVAGGCR